MYLDSIVLEYVKLCLIGLEKNDSAVRSSLAEDLGSVACTYMAVN